MIRFIHAAQIHGASALMEHPSFPTWVPAEKKPPSIELLPELQWLAQKPAVQLVKLHQCMLGVVSKKRTSCHLVNLPEVASELLAQENGCMCVLSNRRVPPARRATHKHAPLSGFDEDDNFKTAPSKQYPPQMNNVMARDVIKHLEKLLTVSSAVDWNSFMDTGAAVLYVPIDHYLAADDWGQYGSDSATYNHTGAAYPGARAPRHGGPVAVPSSAPSMSYPAPSVAPAMPVPQVTPELAALIAEKKAGAFQRRQA